MPKTPVKKELPNITFVAVPINNDSNDVLDESEYNVHRMRELLRANAVGNPLTIIALSDDIQRVKREALNFDPNDVGHMSVDDYGPEDPILILRCEIVGVVWRPKASRAYMELKP